MRRFRAVLLSVRAAVILPALATLLAPGVARADADPFCVLQKVEVTHLSNGYRITFEADGIIRLGSNDWAAWQQDAQGTWMPRTDHITFALENVRGGAAALQQIAQYPLSHLEFALPPGGSNNTGVLCTLVLYKPGLVTVFRGSEDWDQWDVGTWRPTGGPYVTIMPSQKRDKVLINVISDRSEEPETTRPEPPTVTPRLNVSGNAAALTVQALRADMHELMTQIARQTGAAICVDDPVSSQVTAQFEAMPLPRVLSALGTAYGLCLSQVDGIYHLSLSRPDSATAYWVGQTRTVVLNYLPVKDALLLLPDVALPYVRAATDGNCLVVSGPPAMVERIARDVATLDKPGYHCRLQSWVLATQANGSSLREVMGEFEQGTTRLDFDSDGNLSLMAGSQRARETLVQVQALTASGKLKSQRLPSIWCKNGQSASLFVGQYIYYWRFPRRGTDQILDRTQAGTQVVFSPRTDGTCVTASVSLQSDTPGLGGTAPRYGPLVLRRSANTTVRLDSGQLMLIGGLLQTDDADTARNPRLLPWPLDAVASGRLHLQQRTEVAILVQLQAALTPPVSESLPDELKPASPS